MAKYTSGRQKNLKVGINSYSEDFTSLEVIGKVGIGTTNAQSNLYVVGDGYFTGILTANRIFSSIYGEFTGSSISGTNIVGTSLSISGISTLGNVQISSGIVTATTGVITYYGDGSKLTGINASSYASTAGIATYATTAGVATYASNAGVSTYASSSGIATIAGYATTSGIATVAQGLTGTPDINVGIVTATSYNGSGVNLTGIVTSIVAGTNVTISGSTGQVTINATGGSSSGYANTAGIATYASTAGIASYATYATSSGITTYSTTAGIATYAPNAGVSTYATSSGIATYATTAGVSTSVIGGIASVSQLNVSGITTVGFITATNLYVAGVGTFLSSGLKIRNPANTFEYTITGGAISADRILNIPQTSGTDTIATLGVTQTFAASKTFDASIIASSTAQILLGGLASGASHTFGTNQTSSTLTFGGTSGTGLITFGRATTSQQTDIQAGASGVGTTKTINFGTGGLSGSFTSINIGPTAGVGTVAINSGTNLGIGSTTPTSKLDVVGDAKFTGVVTATTFSGNATSATYATSAGIATYAPNAGVSTYATSSGISTYASTAGIATALQNARNFSITGSFVTAPTISFNGTGDVALAATITTKSIGLGTYTTGDYVKNISGTANQITVTGGTGEGSTPTLSIPSQFTVPQDLTVTRDVQINRNLNVTGNITIGGTTAFINVQQLQVSDPDLVLGFRTDGSNNDVSNDTTANHGGIAIASTEGTPLISLYNPGIGESTLPTYKKIMWFKSGSFTGLGTDAWLSNYAVGIGSTQFPTGTRLAVGSVQFTENDLAVVRNINASGIITTNNLNVIGITTITNANLTNINSTGISTVGFLTATNVSVSGIVTSNGYYISGTQVVSSARQLQNIASLDATTTATIESAIANAPNTFTDLQVTGVSTFTNGPVLIGSGTSTGTSLQRLQVTGGAYIRDSVGIGTTLATNTLDVRGTAYVDTRLGIGRSNNGYPLTVNGPLQSYPSPPYNSLYPGFAGLEIYNGGFGGWFVGVETSGNDDFRIRTSNSTGVPNLTSIAAIQINRTTGNLGIGTTNPTSKLTVQGDVLVSGVVTATTFSGNATSATYATSAGFSTNSGISTSVIGGIASVTQLSVSGFSTLGRVQISTGIITATSGVVTYYGDGSKLTGISAGGSSGQIQYNNAGILTGANFFNYDNTTVRVGIGTSLPTARLSVASTTTGTSLMVVNDNLSDGSLFRVTDNSANVLMDVDASGTILFPTSGNVGIGTTLTSPTSKLQVVGDVTANNFLGNIIGTAATVSTVRILTGIITATTGVVTYYGDGSKLSGILTSGSAGGSTGQLQYNLGGVPTGANFFNYDNTTVRVGIGTSLPTARLSVASTTTGTSLMVVNDNLSDGSLFRVTDNSANVLMDVDANGIIVFNNSGNVGIGTTLVTPTSKLQVAGDVLVSGVVTATTFSGNVSGTAVTATTGIISNIVGSAISISGISTFNTVKISTGIITATSGVVTYYGDGSKLSGVIALNNVSAGTAGQIQFNDGGPLGGANYFNYDKTTARVGIGTSLPTARLSVASTTTGTSLMVVNDNLSDGSLFRVTDNSANVLMDVDANGIIVFNNSGNVGIGTTLITPTSKLQVNGDVLVSGVVTATTFSGNLSGIALTVTTGIITNITSINENVSGVTTTQRLNVGTAGTIFTTTSTGLVGIGTSVPVSRFNVSSPSSGNSLMVVNDNLSDGSLFRVNNSTANVLIDIDANGTILFPTTGNIGIGTTLVTPTSKLQVTGDVLISGIITANTVQISSGIITATTGVVTYYGDGSKLSNIISGVSISTNTTNQAQYLTYVTGTGSTTGFGVTTTGLVFNPSSGNLGIGTTNPTSKLTVVGDTSISGLTTTNNLYVAGVGTFLSSGLKIRNPANTFGYTITGGAIVADRVLNLPVITGTDTVATLNSSQTFGGTNTFLASQTFQGQIYADPSSIINLAGSASVTHVFGTNQTSGTLTFGGTTGTGLITFGQATTSQQTDIQAGATSSGNIKTINFGTGGLSGSLTQINIGPGPSAGVGTVLINSGTNLGIGSATPTVTLDVVGGAKFTGVVTASSFSGNASVTQLSVSGFSTLGRVQISTGIITATTGVVTYYGDGSKLTGITSTSIGINIVGAALSVSGISTLGRVQISTGIITATTGVVTYYGDGSKLTGVTVSATYTANSGFSTSAGIATYASTAGIATYTPYSDNAGIATYASTAGIATYASTAGIATYSSTAGIATYASTAGIATYASTAGIATYASTAGIATYASTAGIATYASTAGIATYASTAGIATNATYATSAGIATYASTAGIATNATYATSAGIATYASTAGIATYASTAGIATYASTAGIATYTPYSDNAGIATVAQGLTGTPDIIVGVVTATSFSGDGSSLTSLNASQLTSGIVPSTRITASSSDFTVGNNLYVTGNISVGGTSAILNAATLIVKDKDIVVGYTTDANNNDVSTDNSANHGGISVASTVGSPIFDMPLAGFNSNPTTYKQFMWISAANASPIAGYSGVGTDAWISNYAIGIGTLTVRNNSRLTVGAGFTVYDTYLDATDVSAKNINAVGIVTATSYNGSGTNLTGIVTSIIAGAGISISGSTGQVTINSTFNMGMVIASTYNMFMP